MPPAIVVYNASNPTNGPPTICPKASSCPNMESVVALPFYSICSFVMMLING